MKNKRMNEQLALDERYKINMDGFMEMFDSSTCPYCGVVEKESMKFLGWGSYPPGGFRWSMKPTGSITAGYECQKCFTKGVIHSNKRHIKLAIELIKEQEK